jgi:hypothetical protein
MVPGSKRETFHLMLCTRERFNPEFDPPQASDALARLPAQLAAAEGTRALISEESLASAGPRQIARLVEACAAREVHVILTLRDLGRQIPSAWQEFLRSGKSLPFDAYLRRLVRNVDKPYGKYWTSKNLIAVLDRWAEHVPRDRMHLVTVPPPGSDPSLLLTRFCSVLDVDPTGLNQEVGRSNASLGRTQAEVLSLVNAHLPASEVRRDVYGEVGKRYFGAQVLGAQSGARTLVPARLEPWVRELSTQFVEHISARDYHVIGDLADLQSGPDVFSAATKGPTDAEIADAAAQALATMLVERMTERRQRPVPQPERRRLSSRLSGRLLRPGRR